MSFPSVTESSVFRGFVSLDTSKEKDIIEGPQDSLVWVRTTVVSSTRKRMDLLQNFSSVRKEKSKQKKNFVMNNAG